jgi:predicted GNAT family N-acyltransferase
MVNRAETIDYAARIAATEHDRLEAYRIRYAVYVAEQRKSYPSVDHGQQVFSDDLDSSATIILVSGENGSCGTVRANFLDSPSVRSAYETQIDLALFSLIPDHCISVCSRLAVLPEHRRRIVSGLLFSEIYRYGLSRNTQLCFEVCAPSLLPIFRRYGFREYLPPCFDPIVGQLHRMVLVLDDLAYLERVRSPFLGIAKQFGLAHKCRPWLEERIEDGSRHTDTRSQEFDLCKRS